MEIQAPDVYAAAVGKRHRVEASGHDLNDSRGDTSALALRQLHGAPSEDWLRKDDSDADCTRDVTRHVRRTEGWI